MLYKYTAVCCITKQYFFFIISAWFQFLRRKTKFLVNLRNGIRWFGSQIIAAVPSTVCLCNIMLLSIDIFYQFIVTIYECIKTDIRLLYCSRFFCIIRNDHIGPYCIIRHNGKSHGRIRIIPDSCNSRKGTILFSAFPSYFLCLSFYTVLCTDGSCKRGLSCHKINRRKILQLCWAVYLSICILHGHTVKSVVPVVLVFHQCLYAHNRRTLPIWQIIHVHWFSAFTYVNAVMTALCIFACIVDGIIISFGIIKTLASSILNRAIVMKSF